MTECQTENLTRQRVPDVLVAAHMGSLALQDTRPVEKFAAQNDDNRQLFPPAQRKIDHNID